MTTKGSFILNGNSRVIVGIKNKKKHLPKYRRKNLKTSFYKKLKKEILFSVNQIVRSPGIYFEKNLKEKSITCTIIPEKGSWITIKLDK